jgi:hypothetical protein
MENSRLWRFLILTLVALAALGGGLLLTAPLVTESQEQSMAKFNMGGELMQPVGYREWIFVGTPVTPNDMNNGKAPFPEFHHVYIHPKAWAAYKKTGKFPDGTILVKELVSVGSKKAASGNGYFEGDYIGLEAAVKDAKRFSKEPGSWAYFSYTKADHSLPVKEKATAFPTAACAACHQAAAAEDMVFTQYYPALRAAKPKK